MFSNPARAATAIVAAAAEDAVAAVRMPAVVEQVVVAAVREAAAGQTPAHRAAEELWRAEVAAEIVPAVVLAQAGQVAETTTTSHRTVPAIGRVQTGQAAAEATTPATTAPAIVRVQTVQVAAEATTVRVFVRQTGIVLRQAGTADSIGATSVRPGVSVAVPCGSRHAAGPGGTGAWE